MAGCFRHGPAAFVIAGSFPDGWLLSSWPGLTRPSIAALSAMGGNAM
jgi:hypothetical protein